MDLADALNIGRAGLAVDLKRSCAVPQHRLGAGDPRVVVAEDTGVLLIAGGVAGDLTQLQMIPGVGRVQQDDAVLGVQIPLHARQRLRGLTGGGADARHDAHTLGLDEYLALFTYPAPDGRAKGVVGAAEPLTVPAGIHYRLLHGGDGALGIVCLGVQTQMTADIRPGAAVFHEHTGDKHAFRHRPLTGSGGLKALAGMSGEAVEVQTVVPVGAADQRQTVGPQVVDGIAEAAPQVLQQRLLRAGFCVEGHRLVQNGPVARLAEVGVRSGNEPQRVVVKAAAHSQVALLGQGLVLVIGAAVGELGGGNVQNAFPCPLGDHVDEAQQVLTGVTEAHAPAQQQGLGCAGGQRQRELHGAYRCPAVSHAAGAGTVFTAWGMDGAP